MPGILPDAGSGGVVTRTLAGVATNPPNVLNAYVPPATFTTSCALTALPSDCTARFTPAQVNAIVSELLCFASGLNPAGTWTCGDMCNLLTNFEAWAAGTGTGSLGEIITNHFTDCAGTPIPAATAIATCTDMAAAIANANGPSTDAGNILTAGTDGRLLAVPDLVTALAAPVGTDARPKLWRNPTGCGRIVYVDGSGAHPLDSPGIDVAYQVVPVAVPSSALVPIPFDALGNLSGYGAFDGNGVYTATCAGVYLFTFYNRFTVTSPVNMGATDSALVSGAAQASGGGQFQVWSDSYRSPAGTSSFAGQMTYLAQLDAGGTVTFWHFQSNTVGSAVDGIYAYAVAKRLSN